MRAATAYIFLTSASGPIDLRHVVDRDYATSLSGRDMAVIARQWDLAH